MSKQRITPCLWFDRNAEEAVNFYTSIFKNSKVNDISYYGDAGPGPKGSVMVIYFELDGEDFIALNGGPDFKFTEAISLTINCDGQKEVDEYWNKLLAGGGQESQCGWLKDRFGLSWQVVPAALPKLLRDKDPAKAQRVMEAMLQMKKLDVERLQRAHDEPAFASMSTGRTF
jgi:predicted 3-demethylubiquinone-9 3-methyltransferase (glyoxalase superfamily)